MSKKDDKGYTQTRGNPGHGHKVTNKGIKYEFDDSSSEDDKPQSKYRQTPGNPGHGSRHDSKEGLVFEYEEKQDEDRKITTKAEGRAKKSKKSRKHRRSRGHKRSRKHRRSRRHRK